MKKQTAGRDKLGEFAPKFAEINDDILFGEVWSREKELSLKTRSMITISALISGGNFEQLRAHLELGKANGITQAEIAEIITHIGFYCGWPKAWSAFTIAKEIYADQEQKVEMAAKNEAVKEGIIFPVGEKNESFAQYFIGQSYLQGLAKDPEGKVGVGNVTFEPGCRNNWHIHRDGYQILLVTGGEGWYQEEGQPAQKLQAGDVVVTPDGVEHWHGAAKDSWFAHIAITTGTPEWLEPVEDAWYEQL